MTRLKKIRLGCLLSALALALPAAAQRAPLWEFGVGVGALRLPYYRGTDVGRAYLLPFPYLVYRGERLNIDDGAVRSRLFRSERVTLDLSLAGGVPVSSNGASPRGEMPGLDPTAELGPSLELRLWQGARARSLWLRLPLRAAFAVGGAPFLDHQGWAFAPFLEYVAGDLARGAWKVALAAGPQYADADYHAYFYEVPAAYATALRPEYRARGGYSGARITLGLQRRIGRLWLGAFARYDTLAGAAFAASPLVSTEDYFATGVAASWIFARSARLVDAAAATSDTVDATAKRAAPARR